MWVYNGDSLTHRVSLPDALGYWLDYWLFLNADETHRLWCARPIGLRLIATAALTSSGKKKNVLRAQLAADAVAASRIVSLLRGIAMPPSTQPLVAGQWRNAWLDWFKCMLQDTSRDTLVDSFAAAIGEHLTSNDLSTVNFLTRRLAAELADRGWSPRELFRPVKYVFCDAGDFDFSEFDPTRFAATLRATFSASKTRQFQVSVDVAPVRFSFAHVQQFRRWKLILERVEGGQGVLRRIDMTVNAEHHDQAAAEGLEWACELIERLRVAYYTRTQLIGDIIVRDTEGESETFMPLPHPFWADARARRDVPGMPKNFRGLLALLPEDRRHVWRAAQWHVSQALAVWADDGHSAASHVWQGLEAFTGSPDQGRRAVLDLVPQYISAVVPEMAGFLGDGLNLQKDAVRRLDLTCTWPSWNLARVPLAKWVDRVLRAANEKNASTAQPLPRILVDARVGLLRVIEHKLHDAASEIWMEERVSSDLKLLYALRNAVVHQGERLLSRRGAMYLGQVGLEVLLTVMRARSKQLRDAAVRASSDAN